MLLNCRSKFKYKYKLQIISNSSFSHDGIRVNLKDQARYRSAKAKTVINQDQTIKKNEN